MAEILPPERLRMIDRKARLYLAGAILFFGGSATAKTALEYLANIPGPQMPTVSQQVPYIIDYRVVTNTPEPSFTPAPTRTPRPTETRVLPGISPTAKPSRTPTKKVEATKTATKTAETKTVLQTGGKSLRESVPIDLGKTYTIKPDEPLYFIVGGKDQNKIKMGINIVSAPGLASLDDRNAFSFQLFDDRNFNQLLEYEKNLTDMPHDKGYGTPNKTLGVDRYIDGGHGEGLAWVARFFNKTNAPVSFRADILTRSMGNCNAENSGAYWEYIHSVLTFWNTCDPNWRDANVKK